MSLDIILSKGLSTALVLLFFAAIVFFLRYLYGPKGRWRDPEWDRWNEEARRELERKLDAEEDSSLQERFTRYARSFFTGDEAEDEPLRLKLEHTFHVLAHARELAASEAALADREVSRALQLSALFHDVGRFEQFVRYHTFADPLSCNHGVLGVRAVLSKGFLDSQTPAIKRLALSAVAMHNRLQVPERLAGKPRAVLLGLRDADKLDILRVLSGYLGPETQIDTVVLLHLQNEPASYSPSVLEALEAGRGALYKDMRYVNDFRILLCTWLYDMNYATSLKIVKREGHLSRIIEGLGALPDVQARVRPITDGLLANV